MAFLGILDSQYARSADEDSIETLLADAAQALTANSQAVLRGLPAQAMAELTAQLAALPAAQRLPALAQWAQQQGLQLDGDSWEHLHTRLGHQQQTRQLLASFQPPRLRCPVQVWWADATLGEADFADPQWQQLSSGAYTCEVVQAQHLNILAQPSVHQQLAAGLAALATDGAV